MSSISERFYCAGWIDGLEFKLWRAAFEEPAGFGLPQITNEEIRQLQVLSARCGGWVVFDDKLEETFVPLPEWRMIAARTKNDYAYGDGAQALHPAGKNAL